ncbi:MAG: zf-HC2 domain-containing protein, partial [Anaerolineae bacterium]|nr:zf-HC2 domain-containing protein [Anaerolineae bacterium]
MGAHPPYYTHLAQRWFDGEPPLTPAQAHELELHLLICPVCAYATAQRLMADEPAEAQRLMAEAVAMLRGNRLIAYLRDLAETMYAGR